VNFRVRVTRAVDKLSPVPQEARAGVAPPVPTGGRPVTFADATVLCPVYAWEGLEPGGRLEGPAIVEGNDTTVISPPGWSVETDRWRNLVIARDGSGDLLG
jgi:N-methylhydantoinase A/oxoprolinase/acetone carboxylase beta subunit